MYSTTIKINTEVSKDIHDMFGHDFMTEINCSESAQKS